MDRRPRLLAVSPTGYPAVATQLVAVDLVARVSGVALYHDAIHMMLDDSKHKLVNVVPAGDAITEGAEAEPSVYVPPDKGRNMPVLDREERLVTDAMPGVAPVLDANSPPSGEMAMPREEPTTAREVTPPVLPSRCTEIPVYDAVQKMEPLTEIVMRCSFPGVPFVVVSTTPAAVILAYVQAEDAEVAPAPAATP